jgi:hypothetical protein
MNASSLRWSISALVLGLFVTLAIGCVVRDGGYGGGVNVAGGLDYYEPYGADYGGWGPGYQVGPVRGGDYHHAAYDNRSPSAHSSRAYSGSRSAPSIPGGSREH